MVYDLNEMPYEGEYNFYSSINRDNQDSCWANIAETTMPLTQSKMASVNRDYTQLNGVGNHNASNGSDPRNFNASLELSAKEISRKLILVNVISLLTNLALALVAFYFAFVNDSSSASAFAADCVLDFISSAIVLWRYCGDNLSSVCRHAREQIACIYLGALFEISALAIIVKATSDMVGAAETEDLIEPAGYDLVYLAVVATIACSVLTIFKCALFKTIRDNSILLDVINTLISTVFAMSIIMSQALINVNPSFWYLDPVISIVLALFMAGFGLKVIHHNFNILRPVYRSTSSSSLLRSFSSNHSRRPAINYNNKSLFGDQTNFTPANDEQQVGGIHFGANLNTSIEFTRNQTAANGASNNWQKSDYSIIAFM